MLSPQAMSVNRFFERQDPEKQFILSQIQKSDNPERTMENFKKCLKEFNSRKLYDDWMNCGFYVIVREDAAMDTRSETLDKLAKHFELA